MNDKAVQLSDQIESSYDRILYWYLSLMIGNYPFYKFIHLQAESNNHLNTTFIIIEW